MILFCGKYDATAVNTPTRNHTVCIKWSHDHRWHHV